MRRAEHVTHIKDMRNAYRIFVGKPERKRVHGKMKHKWDNIKLDILKK
jgi:hypothetical protein